MRLAHRSALAALLAAVALALAGCGGSSSEGAAAPAATETTAVASGSVTLVSPQQAADEIAAGDVEVIDVRTPEEYAEGHLEGATLIDFYAADFAAQLDRLDPAQSYVVYCRSGNRSGQATALMAAKGFADVLDVDGGVLAWESAGLPLTTG